MALKKREKLLVVFAAIAIAILAFHRLYYAPQSYRILRLKQEIKAADQKIDQYLLLTKGVGTVEAEVARLERELKALSERTLKGEEFRTFLRHLARESDSPQMKVISLTPQEEKPSLLVGIDSYREGKKESSPFQYRRVAVQVVFHSTYSKLGNYIKGIKELPFLINIESLQIERNEEIVPLLKVTMGLTMHIISL
jgi:Tfp pilus assembly protein PilO